MLISLLLILITAAGGLAITYLVDDDAPLLWRLAAGNVIGCAVLGTAAFVLSLAFGLNVATVIASCSIAVAPALLFYTGDRRRKLRQDWTRAKDRLQGASRRKFVSFAYYLFFFLLFFFFFDRAMLETAGSIFTGGSQNLGDLPFHLGAIFSFTEANNFPPQNPSFAGARFSYPFVADLVTACAVKIGAQVRDAMFVQNVMWAFSLLVVLERFVFKLTKDRLASRIAPALLFLSGGLGFIWAFGDFGSQTKGLFDFLNALPKDYTIGDQFRWGNSMVVLFITQRSLLLGMPLTLIVLGWLWTTFASEHTASPRLPASVSPLIVGVLAGLLPLIHLHSLVVLFVVGVSLFIIRPERWLTWTLFAAGVAVIAIPELGWSISGSATETKKFFAWHFGWDKGQNNFFWFWLKNTGIFIPLLLAGICVSVFRTTHESEPGAVSTRSSHGRKDAQTDKAKPDDDHSPFTIHHSPLIWFYIPFAILFVVSNIAKLAPWEWDNIKVLIYWFVGSLPFAAIAIAWAWRTEVWLKVLAAICFFVLIASGALDVWRTASGQINYKVFDKDAVEIGNQIRLRTPANSLFLNAPTYNTAVVLSGRQSLMRYPGHLGSHGIDYGDRERDLRSIYSGGPATESLIDRYGVNFVLFGPEVTSYSQNPSSTFSLKEDYFKKYPVAAEAGAYKVYKVR